MNIEKISEVYLESTLRGAFLIRQNKRRNERW
nr:MAG TPA: hypothetical protein [Caudoviricetes sp.]